MCPITSSWQKSNFSCLEPSFPLSQAFVSSGPPHPPLLQPPHSLIQLCIQSTMTGLTWLNCRLSRTNTISCSTFCAMATLPSCGCCSRKNTRNACWNRRCGILQPTPTFLPAAGSADLCKWWKNGCKILSCRGLGGGGVLMANK